jgi:hypothetical protein
MTHVIKTTEHHTLKGGLTQETGSIVKEGVLKKLAIKSGRNWKKRYFKLFRVSPSKMTLCVYGQKTRPTTGVAPNQTWAINHISRALPAPEEKTLKRRFTFKLIQEDGKKANRAELILCADLQSVADAWCAAINSIAAETAKTCAVKFVTDAGPAEPRTQAPKQTARRFSAVQAVAAQAKEKSKWDKMRERMKITNAAKDASRKMRKMSLTSPMTMLATEDLGAMPSFGDASAKQYKPKPSTAAAAAPPPPSAGGASSSSAPPPPPSDDLQRSLFVWGSNQFGQRANGQTADATSGVSRPQRVTVSFFSGIKVRRGAPSPPPHSRRARAPARRALCSRTPLDLSRSALLPFRNCCAIRVAAAQPFAGRGWRRRAHVHARGRQDVRVGQRRRWTAGEGEARVNATDCDQDRRGGEGNRDVR